MRTEAGSPSLRVTELGDSERLCWDEACVEVKVISCSWVAIRRWRCLLAEWLHLWLWSSLLCIPALACPAAKVERAAKVKSFPPSAPIQPFGITCIWHWSRICQRPETCPAFDGKHLNLFGTLTSAAVTIWTNHGWAASKPWPDPSPPSQNEWLSAGRRAHFIKTSFGLMMMS